MLHNQGCNKHYLTRAKMVLFASLLICSLICLNSCLFPEKFIITINITKDGKYSFVYDGFFIDDSTREASLKGESSSEPKSAKEIEENLRKISYFKEIKYLGEGKFKVLFKQEGDVKTGMGFIDKDGPWVAIEPFVADIYLVSATAISKDNEEQAKKLNFTIDGTIVVTTNAKVLGHNAKNEPKYFGWVGNYTWDIKSPADPTPKMLLKIN